jgi:hypothetical protein
MCCAIFINEEAREGVRTLMGSWRNSCASCWMDCGHVALKRAVCRAGIGAVWLMMERMACSKPWSSMRSASSCGHHTRHSHQGQRKVARECKEWRRLFLLAAYCDNVCSE